VSSPRYFDSGDVSLGCVVYQGGLDETFEQRMAVSGTGLELWVELTANKPRMPLDLDHLNQATLG